LLAVGILLVFFGTLAQIDFGIWTVVDKYFWSWTVDVPFELFRKFFNVFWKETFPASDPEWKATFPFPAGKLVGALMLINLLAAHATRFRLSWKRAGVFLIHGGLILLFAGEFITREFAVEQQMRIEEGSSTDFAIDTRNVELAFVDPTNPAFDRTVVISQKRLKETPPGARISHPDLPVDVEVLKFMKNSDLLEAPKFDDSKVGVNATFVDSPKGTAPAAYVRLYEKGTRRPVGAFAVAPQIKEQPFSGGSVFGRIALRDDGLLVTDATPGGFDRVFKVPPGRLRDAKPGERLTHPEMPFEIDIVKFMPKAELLDVAPLAKARVAGLKGDVVVVEAGEESGVATKQRGDATAAYVRLYKKGTDEVIGVHAVSLFTLLQNQPVIVGDVPYQLSLRNAHYYKPYRVYLDKFKFDRYEGTEKPKNFSSDVRVYDKSDPPGTEPRTFHIAMNQPMRYAGETFYQADWDKNTEKATVLQVVKNPGQIDFGLFHASIDYIACTVVSAGLLLHFGIFLVRFLFRTGRRPTPAPGGPAAEGATSPPAEVSFSRIFPWLVLAFMGVYLLSIFGRMAPPREPYDLDTFGKLPVLEGGRVKPLESVARVNLRMISGREDWTDESGKTQPAIKWYLDVLAGGGVNARGAAWQHKVIRIDNEVLLNELNLKVREGLRYSMEELSTSFPKIAQAGEQAEKKIKAGGKLDTTEMKYEELVKRINTIFQLAAERGPLMLPPQSEGEKWKSLGEFRRDARGKVSAAVEDETGMTEEKFAKLTKEQKEEFAARIKAEVDKREKIEFAKSPTVTVWDRILTAYREKRPDDFNAAVREYKAPTLSGKEAARTRIEVLFNRYQPFAQCAALYVIGFVLTVVGFVMTLAEAPAWARALRRSATLVLVLAFVVHFLALLARMYIMDRPLVFVTNLYSSAIFIGCGCVALCLVLEGLFPLSIGNLVAASLGFATCVVAHNLATEDTLEMMQAVLDTNFWLATHVTTVTLGYTATFVAGFLGAVYVLMKLGAVIRDGYASKGEPTVGELLAFGTATLGLVSIPIFFLWFVKSALAKFEAVHPMLLEMAFYLSSAGLAVYGVVLMVLRISAEGADAQGRPLQGRVPAPAAPVAALALTPESGKILGQMIYGVIAFATLLSFVGTVLGGIWADQSWGRFWGWDPKENGAVLIVLWNALILHARWCGLVKDRGVAALAVVGNAITAWSWFGTNQLGIGLHAYGFDSRLADGCFNFWLLQGALALFGASIPRRFWQSAVRRAAQTPVAAAEPVAPPPSQEPPVVPPNGPVPTNGPANGSANGNGHAHRDKGKKKHGKR
ncbi:MAG TPA: cytochrome c biogenesis protein ResB, partial [Gemmata sp.]